MTSGHNAKVEEKPEVKKARGVYYTPEYIVEYIVKNTVGRLVEEKTPKKVEELKILDPACGSGSFLIGAYQYLLNYHLKWYTENSPEKYAKGKFPAVYRSGEGWRLTTQEKKRILLNNIFGVDIDRQAVEVTKLSLLLKVLEDENRETIGKNLLLFRERVLPNLDSNIKCGNSLIGTDFYSGSLPLLPYRQGRGKAPSPLVGEGWGEGDELNRKLNPFDWHDPEKGFGKIMNPSHSPLEKGGSKGGFDAVIGNPPYGYMIPEAQQNYFAGHYKHQDYQKDLYLLFLERYEHFLKHAGLLGVIVSNTWLQSVTYQKIRKYLATHYLWLRILHLPEKVFRAVIDTHVLIFEKDAIKSKEAGYLSVDARRNNEISFWHKLPWKNIPKNGDPINIVVDSETQRIFRQIRNNSQPLQRICTVYNGVKPFEKGKGNPPQTEQIMHDKPFVKEGKRPGAKWSPLLRGSLINRYQIHWNEDYWILYGQWLAAPRDPEIFEASSKIMIRQTGDSIIGTLIDKGYIARNNLHIVLPQNETPNLRYILGVINSRLVDFVYTLMNPEKGEALAEVKKHHVEQLPIRTIDFNNKEEKEMHDQMVSLVDKMLDLNEKLKKAKTPHDRELIERQIKATDSQIDRLVYELYGLTEEEIRVVEGE